MKKKPSLRNPGKSGKSRPPDRQVARQKRKIESVLKEPPRPAIVTPAPQPPSPYARIFERLLRSFRMHMFECLGDRCGEAIIMSEKKISLLTPEFDREALTDETAPLIAELIGEIVRNAPFFKRRKLRRVAIVLIADLYNKHYQMLEERNAVDRIEQVYYRLKK